MSTAVYIDELRFERDGVRFPLELRPPQGFVADDPGTWPAMDGRLELVGGRLLYMPPCGDVQASVVAWGNGLLVQWVARHPESLQRCRGAERLPAHPDLPGLEPTAADWFAQLR